MTVYTVDKFKILNYYSALNIQNNCANIRDIVNGTIYVDQMSHYHVPGEIVKGEIVKGVINQANLQ